MPWLMGC